MLKVLGTIAAFGCAFFLMRMLKAEEPPEIPELDCAQGTYQVKDKCVQRADLPPPPPSAPVSAPARP